MQLVHDGIITFGNYISFCPDTYRNKDCEDYYGGMDVYKLNMIFGKVKPNSSMLKHRKQMKENKKNGPYALIIYSNGMIEFRSNSNNSIFRTNIYGKGISPYSIDITENSELVISDFKGMIIYKSNPWRKLPTVEITAFEKGRRYTYVNGYASGNYYKELESLKIYIKNYEGLGIRYSPYILGENQNSCNDIKTVDFREGEKVNGHLLAFKAHLFGKDADKFKLCYMVYVSNVEDHTKDKGWSYIRCDFKGPLTFSPS